VHFCLPTACALPLTKGTSARPAGSSQMRLHWLAICEEGGNVSSWPISGPMRCNKLDEIFGAAATPPTTDTKSHSQRDRCGPTTAARTRSKNSQGRPEGGH
jgi:hypothetical protein